MRRAGSLLLLVAGLSSSAAATPDFDRTGTQWYPFLEWVVTNPTFERNPHDLEAIATFQHPEGEIRKTGLFYAGDQKWKFRFTATRPGVWTLVTSSNDPELNGLSGKVTIEPNPDPRAHGFLKRFGNKWGWEGTERPMVPQLMMYNELPDFAGNPDKIDRDIQTFLKEHGFNGFHVGVLARWFSFDHPTYDGIKSDDPNPDPRTFDALELLITRTHRAGGMVHLWAWGDEQRHMSPVKWGINGKADRRLQRYLAARLGPLPGWSMGYGFDLDEWVGKDDLQRWHTHLHAHLGWSHFLGGRSGGPNHGTDHRGWQIYDGLDYAGYEHWRPTLQVYAAALDANPEKPVLSEDRFRVRKPSPYPEKDYDEALTRRGLWQSTMAGGVGNIWGNLTRPTGVYEHREWIRTWATFFENRFVTELQRDDQSSDGASLGTPDKTRYILYKEDTDSIRLTLADLSKDQPAIAVDTLRSYQEIDLGRFGPGQRVWKAPYKSDWALAIGKFGRDRD